MITTLYIVWNWCFVMLLTNTIVLHIEEENFAFSLTSLKRGQKLTTVWLELKLKFRNYKIAISSKADHPQMHVFLLLDKDGGRAILSAIAENPILHANFMALSSIEPELLPVEVLCCRNEQFSRFFLLWPWPWPSRDDLHIQTWPLDPVPIDQRQTFCVCQGFWKLSYCIRPYRQTYRQVPLKILPCLFMDDKYWQLKKFWY